MADITSRISEVGTTGYSPCKAVYTDPSTNIPMNVILNMYDYQEADQQAHILNRLARETAIWSQLSHPNIVPLIGRCTATHKNIQCLAYPLYENGSISNYVQSQGSTLNEVARLSMVIDVAKAVQFIHAHDVVHGEIDTVHIMVSVDQKALLYGFARAKVMGHAGHTTEAPNSALQQFVAPELLFAKSNSQLNKAADVYSFGLIALYILSGSLPCAMLTPNEVDSRLVQASNYPNVNPRLWQILSRCIVYSPGSRATIDEVLYYLVQASSQ